MSEILKRTRRPRRMRPAQFLLYGAIALIVGLVLGLTSKLLDVYTQNIGNMFSGIAVWILICTFISVRSPAPLSAAFSVLMFCVGMLFTYYCTAEVIALVYNRTFVMGWTALSLFSPFMAYVVWYAGGHGVLAKAISCGVVFIMLAATHVLFGLRFYDIIISGIAAIFLFCARKH